MQYFEWDSSYNSGIEIIDAQHKRLIQIINGLYLSMKEGKGNEILIFAVDDFLEYTYYHFETEENHMKELGFKDFDSHRAEHDLFARKMLSIKNNLSEKKVGISLDILNFLKDWWRFHILSSDMKYFNYQKT